MALSKEDLLISIAADTKGAVAGLKDVAKGMHDVEATAKGTTAAVDAANKTVHGLGDKMKELAHWAEGAHHSLTGFGAANVVMHSVIENVKEGVEGLHKAWEATVGAFQESQDTIKRLATTLALMGAEHMPETVKEFSKFSKELQETSTVSEETSMKLLQLASAAGMPAEKSMQLVRTSANVAAATGKSIDEVFQRLKDSTKGMTRGVADFAPELAGMAQGAAKAGDAISYLDKKFAGFAKEELNTASGQMKYFRNTVDEAMRDVGGAILSGLNIDLNSGGLIKFAEQLKSSFNSLVPVITDTVAVLKSFAVILSDVVIVAVETVTTPIRVLINTFMDLKDLVTGAFLKKGGPSAFSNLKEEFNSTTTVAKEAFKDMGASATEAMDVIGNSGTNAVRQAANLDKMLEAIDKKNTHMKPAHLLSEDQLKLLEDLTKMVNDLRKKTADIGATETQKIHLDTMAQMEQIDAMRRKLIIAGALTKEAQAALKLAEESVKVQEVMRVHEAQAKAVEEVGNRIRDNNKYLRDFGETQQTIIANQLQAELADIDRLEAKAVKEGTITDELKDQLETMRQQAKEKAADQTKQVGQSFDLFKPDDISKITAALGPTAGGFGASVGMLTSVPMGMMGAANMFVDAAQKMVDFVPAFINKVAHLIDSITDLPLKLADAFQHLFDAIVRAVANFIPNLFKMVEKLLDGITGMIEKLPEALISVIDKLPTMIMHLADKIPALVQRIITALISGAPKLIASLINLIIRGIPMILKDVIRQLPILIKAIVNGIIDGIKESIKSLVGAFKGWNPIDTGAISDTVKSIGSNISKQSSKLFEVIDANAAAAGNNTAKGISDAIDGAVNRAMNILKQLWRALKDLWNWIWDHVLNPFLSALSDAWHWVLDHVITPIAKVVQEAWQWVIDKVWTPMANLVKSAWQWVVDKVWTPLAGLVSTAWQWVVDKVWTPLAGLVSTAWQWVIDKVYKPLTSVGQSVYQWVKDNVVDKLAAIGQPVWQWVKDKIVDPLNNVGKGVWQWVKDNIVDKLSGIGDKLSGSFSFVNDFKSAVDKVFGGPGWIQDFKNAVNSLTNWKMPSVGGGGGGGGGNGGVLGKMTGGVLAAGGMVTSQYAASGLLVPQFVPRGPDQQPYMLAAGEFVMNRRAVSNIGPGALAAMNALGKAPSGDTHIEVGGITIQNHGDKVDDNFVRSKIMPTFFKELKKATTEGRFVASNRGLRNV